MVRKDQHKAYVFAMAAVLCWSTMASAFKLSLRYLPYHDLLFYSAFIACLVHLIVLWLQDNMKLLTMVTRREVISSAVMGLLNPFLYYVVLFKSYSLLKAQEAGVLNYIWPILLMILSVIILKQKIRVWSFVAILISFSGILVISAQGSIIGLQFREPLGVLLATGSGLLWALYWILNMKDKREEVSKLLLNFIFGFLYIFLAKAIWWGFEAPPLRGLAGTAYIGLSEMGITFILWLKALRLSANTAKISHLVYLSPFLSLIIIGLVVGEKILPSTVGGLCLIVTGIILQQRIERLPAGNAGN
jgi:drug/metabolite transporter (DMT)-like permease